MTWYCVTNVRNITCAMNYIRYKHINFWSSRKFDWGDRTKKVFAVTVNRQQPRTRLITIFHCFVTGYIDHIGDPMPRMVINFAQHFVWHSHFSFIDCEMVLIWHKIIRLMDWYWNTHPCLFGSDFLVLQVLISNSRNLPSNLWYKSRLSWQ